MLRTAQFIDTYFPVIDGVIRTVYNYAYYLNQQTDYCCVFAPRYKGYKDNSPFDVFRTAGLKIPFIGYSYSMPKLSKATSTSLKQRILIYFMPILLFRWAIMRFLWDIKWTFR